MPISQYHGAFQYMHADGGDDWIRLHEMIQAARASLQETHYRPVIHRSGTQRLRTDAEKAYLASYQPETAEVSAAFGDYFLDGSWPDCLSEVQRYWIGLTLVSVESVVWSISPTPNDSLTPTIIRFPPFEVKEVALWFCTEWWITKGFRKFIIEVGTKYEES